MSKPTNKETHRPKPFYKDEHVEISGNQKDHMIISWTLKIGNKSKFFEVKNGNILKAFKDMENYFAKNYKPKK